MEAKKGNHRTTDRLMDILELVSGHMGEYTLSDISLLLKIPKSTLSPMLHTLTVRNYLSIDSVGRYSIGTSTYFLGRAYLSRFSFLDEVEKILKKMTDACMETAHFAKLSGGDVFYLRKSESPQSVRMVSSVGSTLPAYSTAIGKALLMDHTKEALLKLYPQGLVPLTPNTVTDPDVLFEQILLARKNGYTTECEESNEYIRCMAVPVRKDGEIMAAFSIAMPVFRFDHDKETQMLKLLFSAQEKIEKLIDSPDINLTGI